MNSHRTACAIIRPGLVFLGAFSALMPFALAARAMSSTTQVAWKGEPVAAVADWSDGVLDLVNDLLRTDGWNSWFSEWPNDVNWYEFRIQDTADVNRLIEKLAAMKAPNTCVRLDPGKVARALAFTRVLSEEKKTAAMFSIGSQKRINEWYHRLEEVEPGVRKFGVRRFQVAPVAMPLTLTIYAGHEAIDLKQLEIPGTIEVFAVIPPAQSNGQTPPRLREIERFVAKLRARSTAPSAPSNQPDSR